VRPGMSTWATMVAIGQPSRRLGNSYSYCSTGGTVRVQFSTAGRVSQVLLP
jgi:hypothetical protein